MIVYDRLLFYNQHFFFHRSWLVNCLQTILWCLMKSHLVSGGGSELPLSWTKVWSIWIKRYSPQSVFTILGERKVWAKETIINLITLNVKACLHCRIQSCKNWRLAWLFSCRFMRRLANSLWKGTSANPRRRAVCSSARGRRRKWRICRRPCYSTGSRASVTHRASVLQPAKTKVSDTAALVRPNFAMHSREVWMTP